jgi:hypothetical protein
MSAQADALMAIFGLRRVKTKCCKVCKTEYQPRAYLQVVCGPQCAAKYAAELRRKAGIESAKKERAELKAKKEKLKTRSDWARETQSAVNAYVRLRDAHLPCISCGRHHQGQYHAGHYLSRGAHPELAYEPMNMAKQCQPCNTHLSGNQINFRKGLIDRIGLDWVEWLEGPHEPKKWTVEELKAIRDKFRALTKQLREKNK